MPKRLAFALCLVLAGCQGQVTIRPIGPAIPAGPPVCRACGKVHPPRNPDTVRYLSPEDVARIRAQEGAIISTPRQDAPILATPQQADTPPPADAPPPQAPADEKAPEIKLEAPGGSIPAGSILGKPLDRQASEPRACTWKKVKE